MNNFRTLDQAKEFYKEGQKLKLKGPTKNQFERALLSIPLNLAEEAQNHQPKNDENFTTRLWEAFVKFKPCLS